MKIGAAVKDRRRVQRATTTGRELVQGRESPSPPAGPLNRVSGKSGLRRWCCPFWNRSIFWKGQHPGPSRPRRHGWRRPGPQAAGAV